MTTGRDSAAGSERSGGAPMALLFPGQGSQTAEMASEVARWRPDLLKTLRDELGPKPFEDLAESTGRAQPAIFCASVALWEAAGRPRAEFLAGHSLGELSALAVGGAIDPDDGLRLAIARGRLMDEAAAASPGGMLAVLGEPAEEAELVARRFGLAIANENAPGQVVLSGGGEAIAEARRTLRAEGAKTIRLPVAGAFHSPAMRGARRRFRKVLDEVEFRAPSVPVFSSVLAAPFADPREALARALTDPVRWRETVDGLLRAGVRNFAEVGPGTVLTGLVRRIAGESAVAEPLPAMEPSGA